MLEFPRVSPPPPVEPRAAVVPEVQAEAQTPAYWLTDLRSRSVNEQRAYLLDLLQRRFEPNSAAMTRLRQVITSADKLSFGNPAVSKPAMTQAECFERWRGQEQRSGDSICGHENMVKLDKLGSGVCIDQFEFPNIACEYPVVWVRASEAAAICEAQGKRLCDAHEWEGACAGRVDEPGGEYHFAKLPKGIGAEYRRNRRLLMEDWHNRPREITWAYGPEKDPTRCAMASRKSPKCGETTYEHCGTNNYPAGSFPQCVSEAGVYDQHGNVAEHMSFPLTPEDLGGWGYTEMKGSWFIASETHPDDCRWRAKNWHTTRVTDPNSHNNYHLGFRCCAGPGATFEAP